MLRPTLQYLLPLVLIASISAQAIAVPAARAAQPGVQVDNSQSLGAARGAVLDGSPDHASLAIDNSYDFWSALIPQAPAGQVSLSPANPAHGVADLGGVYASLGVIGPDARAVWDGRFDALHGASQTIIVTPSIYYGHLSRVAIALDLNALTVGMAILGVSPRMRTYQDLVDAINILGTCQTFSAAIQDAISGDFPGFAANMFQTYTIPAEQALIIRAFAKLGVVVTEQGLEWLSHVGALYEMIRMVWHELRAIATEKTSAKIRFYVAGAPRPRPTATPVPVTPSPALLPSPTPSPPPVRADTPTPGPPNAGPPPGFSQYTSLQYPYRLAYPSSWQTGSLGKIETFIGPTFNSFATNVNVVVQPVGSWVTTDDYYQQIKTKTEASGATFDAEQQIQLDREAAWLFDAHYSRASAPFGQAYAVEGVVLLHDGQGWQITLSADPSEMSDAEGDFRQMLSSFTFVSP